jgi:hypothetical protein
MATKRMTDPTKPGGKIRFVLFEAEGVDGNLSDIAQAITSALKSQGAAQKALPGSTPRRQINAPDAIEVEADDQTEAELEEAASEAESRTSGASPATSRKRFIRKVKVL